MEFNTKKRRFERKRFYKTKQWRKLRQNQLRKAGLCEICLKNHKLSVASVVDHISPHWNTFKEFLTTPVQSLCQKCHSTKTFFYDVPSMIKKQKTSLEIKDI